MGNFFTYARNDYELVIQTSKDLEHFLEEEFYCKGKGLHEKLNDFEIQYRNSAIFPNTTWQTIQKDLISPIRYLATIRNKLIHQVDFKKIPDRDVFIQKYEKAQSTLQFLAKQKNPQTSCTIM